MQYFPAFLDLTDRRCLVVGGGDIALRKVRLLVSAGARVTAVATGFSAAFRAFAGEQDVELVERAFDASDVEDCWLVVTATADTATDRAVHAAASAAQVFCNAVDDTGHSSYITPAIVDRGDVVIAISSGGAAPVLARRLREKIEAAVPVGIGRLAALAKRWRGRVQARFETLIERRRFWEAAFSGKVASAAIAGDVGAAEAGLRDLLESGGVSRRGEAWLVGAGPGDPGFLTLRGLQILQQADVILHDRLVSKEILALARRDADLVSVGKTPGCRANSQEEINALLVALVADGKRVCRLKGGDPFIFGRGGEEAEALHAAGFDCEVVPGITAAAGCAARAGIPLTHRDLAQSLLLVTAHGRNSVDRLDWPSLARERQTIAFYMAVSRFRGVMTELLAHGRAATTPVAIVENGTTPEQRVVRGTLSQLTLLAEAHNIRAPAILIVGEVAALGEAGSILPAAVKYAKKPSGKRQQQG